MFEINNIPQKLKEIIQNKKYNKDSVGMSGSNVLLFDDMVLKIQKQSCESDNEYSVMKWLDGKIPVPRCLYYETWNGISYLLMSRINGEMLCSDRCMKDPEMLESLLSSGLKKLQSIDISDCPCINTLDVKLKAARYNVENNLVDMDNVQPETFGKGGFKNPSELLEWLEKNRPIENLVFTHGDYGLPNVLTSNGVISGFIDLGRAGIADMWQDISICYRSLKDNFNGIYNGGFSYKGYHSDMLFEILGVKPDFEKLRYYILLDELF